MRGLAEIEGARGLTTQRVKTVELSVNLQSAPIENLEN
jgi:hypothetical protein